MYFSRRIIPVVSLVMLSLIGYGCAEQASTLLEPDQDAVRTDLLATDSALLATDSVVNPLLRDVPLAEDLTRTWSVKRNQGATLDWPELGLRVVIPARALPKGHMDISITAPAGDVVAYDFGPDGTVFSLPLQVIQNTKGTNFDKLSFRQQGSAQGAYFKSISQVSDANNKAVVDAFQPTVIDLQGNKLSFTITHFSGYLMSTD